jgi:hypothetical protein
MHYLHDWSLCSRKIGIMNCTTTSTACTWTAIFTYSCNTITVSKVYPNFLFQFNGFVSESSYRLTCLPVSSVLASKRYMWYYSPVVLWLVLWHKIANITGPSSPTLGVCKLGELVIVLSWRRRRRLKLQAVRALCFIYSDTMEDSTGIFIQLLLQVM